jgi:MoaA/NifB/PqqE/SkfB family radical SAM enzyme
MLHSFPGLSVRGGWKTAREQSINRPMISVLPKGCAWDTSDMTDFPEQIRLENTNACNAHCVICPREKHNRKIGFIDAGLVRRIVGEAKGRRITKFTVQGFGEPLLDPSFSNHVRLIKDELDCPTFTVSNGSMITETLARDLVKRGLDKIKISFYGINKREYEAVHRKLRYERTVQGVMNLVRAKRAAKSKISIRLQYIGKPWRFVPFFFQWSGKARVGYNTLHNYGGGRAYRQRKRQPRGCPIVAKPILQVLWTGQVVPCCYDFNGTTVLGDLRRQSISDIWKGQRYQAFRRAHVTNDFRDWPLCENCDRRF